MNILVTGSRGFIGSHLIPALKKKYTVRSYDLKDGQDILNEKQLLKAIKWADVVYHLAALTDVQQSFKQKKEYYQTNFVGSLNVCCLCEDLNKKLIYTSTASIYDPFSSPYAEGKKQIERIINLMASRTVVFRLFNVYGEGMNKTTMLARFQKENPITIYGDGKQTRDFICIDDVVDIMVSALSPKWNGFVGDVGTAYEHTVL